MEPISSMSTLFQDIQVLSVYTTHAVCPLKISKCSTVGWKKVFVMGNWSKGQTWLDWNSFLFFVYTYTHRVISHLFLCVCVFLRKSDGVDLKANLMYRARRKCASSQFRAVGFVIFVVDALSVSESMDSVDEDKKQYSQVIAANFKNPLLSFRGTNYWTLPFYPIITWQVYCIWHNYVTNC